MPQCIHFNQINTTVLTDITIQPRKLIRIDRTFDRHYSLNKLDSHDITDHTTDISNTIFNKVIKIILACNR